MTTRRFDTDTELTIIRIFKAPREKVFQAWTDPEWIKQWWGPKGYTAPSARIDARVGGEYLFCMRSPDGENVWSRGVYRELVRPDRIVCTDSFSDENGKIVPASHYGMKGYWPLELLVTLTFEETNGQTKLTLRHAGFPPGEVVEMTRTGWNESLDKLAALLEKS